MTALVNIRKGLIQHRVTADCSVQGIVADWLTAKIGTMWCMAAFLAFVCIPFALPPTLAIITFIGGTAIPLVLMSLFLISANRTDTLRELRAEREHRIQLVYDRIEELKR